MRAYFNGQTMIIKLNGGRIDFYLFGTFAPEYKAPQLITANGYNFITADNKRFLVKEG